MKMGPKMSLDSKGDIFYFQDCWEKSNASKIDPPICVVISMQSALCSIYIFSAT